MATQEIEVVVIADDSGVTEALDNTAKAFEDLDAQAEKTGRSINQSLEAPANTGGITKSIQGTTAQLKNQEKQVKKTTKSYSGLVKGGGRGISMLSRFTGVGGRATRSLGGLAFALGGTPFGGFALAAGAATAAYAFFAKSTGKNTDEVIKKNNELRSSISDLEQQLTEGFREGQLLQLDLEGLTEAESRIREIGIRQENQGRLALEAQEALGKSLEAKNKLDRFEFKTQTEKLELKKQEVDFAKQANDLAQAAVKQEVRVLGIRKQAAEEAKRQNQEAINNEKKRQVLIDSLIENELDKRIKALQNAAKAREENFAKVKRSTEDLATFTADSQANLNNKIKELNDKANQAKIKANKAVLAQLIIDEEAQAKQALISKSEQLKKDIEALDKSDTEKAILQTQNETQLQIQLQAVIDKFAMERKEKAITEQDELFMLKQASLESQIQAELAFIERDNEIARQALINAGTTEEELTALKVEQDNEKLKAELQYQIERLNLIRTFNKQITKEESAAIDAQIDALKTRITGVGTELQSKTGIKEGTGLFGVLGIDGDTQGQVQAVQGAIEQVTQVISDAVAERVAALQKEVDARNERVSELQSDLANELELNNQGRSTNLKGIQKELAAEKAARDKAEAEKKEAAKAQFALDTALQASNLITAISQLYSTLASLPFGIGVALATALSAVMIGAFVSSKASAAKSAGFKEGGFTGYGNPNEEAGPAHKEEFYLDAQTTKEMGLRGKTLEEGKKILAEGKGDYKIPPMAATAKQTKRIKKYISSNSKAEQMQKQQAYTNGITNAIQNQDKYLKKIASKPTIITLPDGTVEVHTDGKVQRYKIDKKNK